MSARFFTAAACVGAVSAYTWEEDTNMYAQFAEVDALAAFTAYVTTAASDDAACATAWATQSATDATVGTLKITDYCDATAFADAAAIAAELTDSTEPTPTTGCATPITATEFTAHVAGFIAELRTNEDVCVASTSSAFTPSLIFGSVAALALRLL
jgi:hypothetical protein